MRRRGFLAIVGGGLVSCSKPEAPVAEVPRKIHVPRAVPTMPEQTVATGESDGKGFAEITWAMLRGLDTRTGLANPLLELVAGTDVKLAGYMVPFDDGFDEVTEFLLVPTAGACVHTPPPPANQIVYATMTTGRAAKVELIFSVWVSGRLEIASTDSPYGQAGFKLGAVKIERRG